VTAPGRLRYRSLIESLWSLRSADHFDVIEPLASAVPYRPRSPRGIAALADVYLPPSAATGASVVLVHGGGFVIGSRRMKPMRFLAARLVAEGIAVFAIDYRLAFRGGRLDEATDDVRVALRFWRERAPQYGLDAGRVSLVGLSAGATLSWLAASGATASELHRLVSVFGLYELDHLQGPLSGLLPRVVFATDDRAQWHARSPRGVPSPVVPTLLLHGTEDGLVPVEQARRLAAHRESLGLPTKLVIYDRAPHGFFNMPCDAGESGAREIADYVR
jgi:acetyl esterase/lipase